MVSGAIAIVGYCRRMIEGGFAGTRDTVAVTTAKIIISKAETKFLASDPNSDWSTCQVLRL